MWCVLLDAEMDSDPAPTSEMVGRGQCWDENTPLHLWRFQIQHLPAPLPRVHVHKANPNPKLSLAVRLSLASGLHQLCSANVPLFQALAGHITSGFVQGVPGPGRVCRL
jgi:hypothetical protein